MDFERRFARRDQFAAEIVYFSRCIRENLEPEPSGWLSRLFRR